MADQIDLSKLIARAHDNVRVAEGVAHDLRELAEATDDPHAWAAWAALEMQIHSAIFTRVAMEFHLKAFANAEAMQRARAGQLIVANGKARPG